MNEETIKRYSLAEIAMLLIFMLGLGIAQLIVNFRQRPILSEPIGLPGSGLAVSMPGNPGWEYETRWRYESGNVMALIAQQKLGRVPKADVQWRYHICSAGGTAEEILQRRIEQTDSQSGPADTVEGAVAMHYTIVYPADGDVPFLLGVAPLDFGRHLELQVTIYQELDFSNADELFRGLVSSVTYQPPHELQAGKALVNTFWESQQTDSPALSQQGEQVFLIKNLDNRPAGYGYYHYSSINSNGDKRIQLASVHYSQLSAARSTLWFDSRGKQLTWKTTIQQAGMGRPREYTLIQEADGAVTVTTNTESDTQFKCEALVLPEVLLGDCAAMLLDGPDGAVVVDVIAATGFVVPTKLERIDPQETLARAEQIAYAVRIDFLNTGNSFEELYFDENRQLIGRYERMASRKQIWELTTPDVLKQIFKENYQPNTEIVAALY